MSSPKAFRSATASSSSDDDSESVTSGDEYSWVSWFCSVKGHGYFCEVDESYIQDKFNLTGMSNCIVSLCCSFKRFLHAILPFREISVCLLHGLSSA
jgi:hypothetical protein